MGDFETFTVATTYDTSTVLNCGNIVSFHFGIVSSNGTARAAQIPLTEVVTLGYRV